MIQQTIAYTENMKKTYITPTSTVVNLFSGEDVMLALSQVKADGTDALSGGKDGWNSTDWTSTTSDEEE